MRVFSAWCATCFAAAVCAAPVAPPDSAKSLAAPNHALHSEAVNYARNLVELVDQIEEKYIRPVSRTDLYEAALAGLYEAVRQPVPDGLRSEVRQAAQRDVIDALSNLNNIVWRVVTIRDESALAMGLIAEAAFLSLYDVIYDAHPGPLEARLQPFFVGDVTPLLVRVRESLGEPDTLRGSKALVVSLQALPRALDPYCGLAPRHEFQRLDLNDNTLNSGLEFVGAPLMPIMPEVVPNRGIRRDMSERSPSDAPPPAPAGPLRVARVQPGSPAQRAGIRPGDMIIRIDGQAPGSRAFAALFQRLRPIPLNPPGTSTPDTSRRLTIIRSGRSEQILATVSLTDYKAETVFGARRKGDGSWDFMLDPAERIGYLRLGGIRRVVGHKMVDGELFSYGSDKEMSDALHSLEASNIRGLVFDLRWCPGGMLDMATAIARQFLPRHLPNAMPVYWQRDRSGLQTPATATVTDETFTDVPVVVLVNGETSGGGELIAAALQDHKRAVVAGQRTVGKASIQNEPTGGLGDMGFKLTMFTFLRPSGKNLQRFPDSRPSDDWGVRPDAGRELPLTAEAGRQLKERWILQTLRPPGTKDALPLDDPANDPQRQAAVQMLREMIKK